MKVLLCFMVLLGVVMPVCALPILTVTEGRYEPNGDIRYFIRISNWGFSDKEGTTCGGQWDWNYRSCNLQLVAFGANPEIEYKFISWQTPSSPSMITMGQLLSKLNAQGSFYIPFEDSIVVTKSLEIKCVSLQVGTYANMRPVVSCAPVKRPPVRCDIGGVAAIDHKTLSDIALDGAQASTQLSLKCMGDADVIIKASRTNAHGVSLRGDSLYSEVKINDKDATDGIIMTVTNNLDFPIKVSSTLKTRGTVAPGPFSGFSVITVAPY